MNDIWMFLGSIGLLIITWLIVRKIAGFIQELLNLRENQTQILDLLEEIKSELKELKENNSEKKL